VENGNIPEVGDLGSAFALVYRSRKRLGRR